jgi:hypothetical protein
MAALATIGPALSGLAGAGGAAAASPGLMGGLSAFSKVAGGVASFSQSKSNAGLMRELGVIGANDERRRTRLILGKQRVAASASGIDANSGSALDIQSEAALDGEVAALRAKFGFDARADAETYVGRQALVGSAVNATGTILGNRLTRLGQNPKMKTRTSTRLTDGVDPAGFEGMA